MAKQTTKGAKGADAEKKPVTVYLYDKKTGAYLGPCEVEDGNYPDRDFTEDKPPIFSAMDETAVYKNEKWEVIASRLIELATLEIAKRDRLLAASDYTQLADAPVDQKVWAEYRQGLRDVTKQKGFPEKIEWPAMPDYEIQVKEEPKDDKGKDAGK